MYSSFENIRSEQLQKAENFEKEKSFEMAYLAYWIILEKTLKVIEVVRKKDKLYKSICEWKSYLENSSGKVPSKITSFTLQEPESIPNVTQISDFIGALPVVTKVMNTQHKNGSTKWRDKRNNIAHQSDSFKTESKYIEYRNEIQSGILEIEARLKEYKA